MSACVLANDLKHARLRDYMKVLRTLDDQAMIDFDEASGLAVISPVGRRTLNCLPTLSLT